MEQVWYTINLGTNPAEPHYVIGDFNCALFTVTLVANYEPVKWTY